MGRRLTAQIADQLSPGTAILASRLRGIIGASGKCGGEEQYCGEAGFHRESETSHAWTENLLKMTQFGRIGMERAL
jgi:hypothetical protein